MKKCSKCKQLKSSIEFGKDKRRKDGKSSWCKKCINNASKEYWKKQYKSNPEKYRAKAKLWKLRNINRCREIQRKSKLKQRIEVLEHYGGKCACCGEKEIKFLSIDHINGGGKKDRQKHGFGNTFYFYLRKNNYPKGFQVLCHNCNLAKSLYGKCPHKDKK